MTQLINKYNTFLKYGIVAGLSFAFDLFLFTLFTYFFSKIIGDYAIITGTICARIISSFVNYLLNKNQVFKTEDGKTLDSKTLIQYYTLTIIQMCVSFTAVFFLHRITSLNATLVKIPVEIILFLINYIVQKKFIFKKR